MNENQIIDRGVVAKRLLSDASFQSFTDELRSLILDGISNTKPEDSSQRENLYFQLNGLRDILGVMQSYSDAAEAILEQREKTD